MALEQHRRMTIGLGGLFAIIWFMLAYDPLYREDWLLENVLVIVLVPLLVVSYRRVPLSLVSYTCIFLFLCIHEIGAHYTYSEVPYDLWMECLFGFSLRDYFGWSRNHFDRLVHFLYGLLLTYPVREAFLRVAEVRNPGSYIVPLLVVMSTSMTFELFEWGAAMLFGGDLGMAYLGTQGDEWDAHQDMFLATCGTLSATVIIVLVHSILGRDYAREWLVTVRTRR